MNDNSDQGMLGGLANRAREAMNDPQQREGLMNQARETLGGSRSREGEGVNPSGTGSEDSGGYSESGNVDAEGTGYGRDAGSSDYGSMESYTGTESAGDRSASRGPESVDTGAVEGDYSRGGGSEYRESESGQGEYEGRGDYQGGDTSAGFRGRDTGFSQEDQGESRY